ncbi:MAG: DUF4364 family protein [Clostridia bacterium]|nr:DUF4364 family protein [Clostridia bacterium]MBQ5813321.1 DUF4364 family protein [Clostridia bacterium]
MRQGYIRETEDVKYLILYSLGLLPFTITEEDLLEIVLIDDGFGYFEFATAFHELLQSEHISAVETGGHKEYLLTLKGKEVVELMEDQLPASVCDKAQAAAIRVVRRIRRADSIRTEHRMNSDGTYTTTLTVRDKNAELVSVSMLVYSEQQCRILEENFRNNAEYVFKSLLNMLLDTDKKTDTEER